MLVPSVRLPELAPVDRSRRSGGQSVFVVVAWLLIGFSDGAILYLMEMTEVNGYLVYLLPVVSIYLVTLFALRGVALSAHALRRQGMIAALFSAIFLFHGATVGSFYIEGFAQLFVMVGLITLFTDLYADNAAQLEEEFGAAMTVVHYIVCGYIVLSWLALHLFDLDISVSYSNFHDLTHLANGRTSGLHREPAWAGIAAATTYVAVQFHRPARMLFPQVAFLAAVAASASGSALLLAGIFLVYQLTISRAVNVTVRAGVAAVLALMALSVFNTRINAVLTNSDPSTAMRIESAIIAQEVIAETFPTGTGIGNFTEYARLDEDVWRSFINLDDIDFYKSDVLVLNLIAELGIFGCILLAWLFMNVYACRSVHVLSVFGVLVFMSGSLIMPYHLVLASVAGLEIARMRVPARRPAIA